MVAVGSHWDVAYYSSIHVSFLLFNHSFDIQWLQWFSFKNPIGLDSGAQII